MAGYVNGSGHEGGRPEGLATNVASLDEARRRVAAKAQAEAKAKRSAAAGGATSWRDRIVGLVLIGLAVAMVWHWVSPLARPVAQPAGVVR